MKRLPKKIQVTQVGKVPNKRILNTGWCVSNAIIKETYTSVLSMKEEIKSKCENLCTPKCASKEPERHGETKLVKNLNQLTL